MPTVDPQVSPGNPIPAPQDKGTVFNLVNNFAWGYRSREDVTNTVPGVLIRGSKNVLTNVSERVQIRQGYALDGPVSSVDSHTLSSFDWLTRGNGERHLRAGGLTSAGNDGKLQYRYVDAVGTVTWRDLITGLSTVAYNFAAWWNSTETLREVLFVNGTSNIFEWNGAITTLLSATAATLTKEGTDTWLDTGFYSAANKQVVINGTTYTYTGGETTTTLTGVTPSPAAETPGSVVHQAVVTTANSAMSGITATFQEGLIEVMNNQVFLGSLTSSVTWLSKVNSFTDYTSSATRQIGEGGSLVLDQNMVAFKVIGGQDQPTMLGSAGKDLWYRFTFTDLVSVVGPSGQTFGALPIKNGRQQGARSQAMVSNMKNYILAVSHETTVDQLGVMQDFLTQFQTINISDSIKLDIDDYDFTNGSIFYYRYNIYVAVPEEGLVLIFNLTTGSWEAPQELPVSRFYIVEGELYGHSYDTLESYRLFTGYADRVYPGFTGFPIQAEWVFSYQNFGDRAYLKNATQLYVEGYINQNTVLNATLTYEIDGCATNLDFAIDGSNSRIVCIPSTLGSLGKESLGKSKLGGAGSTSLYNLPPKFRVIETFNPKQFHECSVSFSVLGTDQRAELLAFGLAVQKATEEPTNIKL